MRKVEYEDGNGDVEEYFQQDDEEEEEERTIKRW